jgi:DNA repair exonuclease SbcCD ATPase subunit
MNLKSFKAKNFKNLSDTFIEFENNTIISGDNGSGKSSILQGITYCLTNNLSEKISEYIKWGENSFELNIQFEHGESNYDYVIKSNGSTTSKDLIINEKEFYKNTEASNKISEIINSDLLLYSSISEQGKSYSILTDTPAQKLKRIKSILGIEKLENVSQSMKESLSSFKEEVKINRSSFDHLKSKEFRFQDEIQLKDIEQIKKDFEIQEKQKSIFEKQKSLELNYNNLLKEYNKNIENKDKHEQEINIINDKLKTYNDISTEKYNSTLVQISKIEKKLSDYNNDLKSYNEYLKRKNDIEIKIEHFNYNISNVKLYRLSNLDFDISTIENLKNNLNDFLISRKEIKNHLSLVKNGKCPTCGQSFNKSHEDLEKELQDIEIQISQMQDVIQTKETILKEHENKKLINEKNKIVIDNGKSNIESLQKELSSLEVIDEPKNIYKEYTEDLKICNSEKQLYESNIKSITLLNDNKRLYESKLNELKNLIQPTEPLYENNSYDINLYESFKKDIWSYEKDVEQNKRIKTFNDQIIKDKNETDELIKQIENKYYELTSEIKNLEDAKNLIDKQFSSYLIEKGTSFIESQMNSFFQKCYPKYSVYFKQTDNKNSIDFYYTDNDIGKISSASLCSGFEKQLLSIAFRVALASITGLGFLILDEVDSDASTENSISLYSNLIDSKLFNQIICITHKEATKEYLVNNYNIQLLKL